MSVPLITELQVVPVAGRDSMLLNLSGAHGPFFTRNIVILKDNAGHTGVGEVPGGEKIRQTLEDARPLVEGQAIGNLQSILNAMRTQFLTTRAAARHMVKRGSGVILHFGGDGPQAPPGLGGFKIALDAITGDLLARSTRPNRADVTAPEDAARGYSEWDVARIIDLVLDCLREVNARLVGRRRYVQRRHVHRRPRWHDQPDRWQLSRRFLRHIQRQRRGDRRADQWQHHHRQR